MKILRKCTTCGFEIYDADDLELFEFDKNAKYQRRNRCQECKQKANKRVAQKRKDNKVHLIKLKGAMCVSCGLEYDGTNAAVFDFHHLDPSKKDFTPSDLVFSLEKAEEEMEKCVLMCANCHRQHHHGGY